MKYKDLYMFPEGHPPSPYDSPVSIYRSGEGYLPKGFQLCAIGWIEDHDFTTGPVPDECIDALFAAYPSNLFSDGTRGIHDCVLCRYPPPRIVWKGAKLEIMGYGHYLVRHKNIVYMAPALLLHYIRIHNYCPPQVFIDATINGYFMTEDDLEIKWRKESLWH